MQRGVIWCPCVHLCSRIPPMKKALKFHCVDSEKFSGRNQSSGCAVAWITIARDSESDYSFNPVGQFRRICAGHLGVRLAQL